MKNYGVKIPIAGYLYVEVEANNENHAKEIAMESDLTTSDLEEWDTYEQLSQGNILYAPLNRIEVEEL